MRRILMMVIRNLFTVPFMWIELCRHAKNPEKYTEEEHFLLMEKIIRRANKGGNVTVECYGKENLPNGDGFIMTPNHQGLYDGLAMFAALSPRRFSVVAKKETRDVPFLKQVHSISDNLLLDRENIRQAMEIINTIAERVKNGKNYVIFPEGTRSKQGNSIGKFKGGSFKAATKAKCPIVPVALIDSFKPFDTKNLKPVTVQVHILEPLYYEEYKDMKTTEIAKIVEERIKETIENNLK